MKKFLAQLVLDYLRYFARLKIKHINPIIIGVTGSAGKTSCRKAIAQILKLKGIVKESLHSNSESGISLNILGLSPNDYSFLDWVRLCLLAPFSLLKKEHYDYYVVEMEADQSTKPKNMDYLLTIIRPDVGVYVSSGVVHSLGFDNLVKDHNPARRYQKLEAAIVAENGKMLASINESGFVVYNSNSRPINNFVKQLKTRKLSVGKSTTSTFRLISSQVNKNGFRASYYYQGQVYELKLPAILEENYAMTYGLALAVGAGFGINPTKSIAILKNNLIIPPGRMRVFKGINKTTIIDSSYNASPATMSSALRLLKSVAGRHPKIAVLGDMRELGSLSREAHRHLALEIKQYCDTCYLFGKETKAYTLPRLKTINFPVLHFDKMVDLTNHLKNNLPPNAFVLVKGSQNTIFLERAVEAILANKKDAAKLARRGKYWDKIRMKTK